MPWIKSKNAVHWEFHKKNYRSYQSQKCQVQFTSSVHISFELLKIRAYNIIIFVYKRGKENLMPHNLFLYSLSIRGIINRHKWLDEIGLGSFSFWASLAYCGSLCFYVMVMNCFIAGEFDYFREEKRGREGNHQLSLVINTPLPSAPTFHDWQPKYRNR